MGVTTLISGAVSGNLSRFIVEKGVRHYPWVNGTVDEVITAYLNGGLTECFGGKKRCEGGRRRRCCINGNEGNPINNTDKEIK
jgi:predicted Fe-Mo cluster-binding NifX family protein